MAWRVVTYNPQVWYAAGRPQAISEAFTSYHFVVLPGTSKAGPEYVQTLPQSQHLFYHSGHDGRPPNRSTGIAIGISRRIHQQHHLRHVHVPAEFRGRVLVLRFLRGDVDITLVAVYQHVESTSDTARQKACQMWKWLEHYISTLPHRTYPILLGDFNGWTGTYDMGNGIWAYQPTPAVGPLTLQKENFNGGQLRWVCERQHLALVNTFKGGGPTYYSRVAASQIDYIAVPQSQLGSVSWCKVLETLGQSLQYMAAPGRRDHRPLACEVRHRLRYSGVPKTTAARWDRHLLAKCVHDRR